MIVEVKQNETLKAQGFKLRYDGKILFEGEVEFVINNKLFFNIVFFCLKAEGYVKAEKTLGTQKITTANGNVNSKMINLLRLLIK